MSRTAKQALWGLWLVLALSACAGILAYYADVEAAKLSIKPGSESVSLYVFIQDSTSTSGAGKTGLAYDTANLKCYYVRPGATAGSIALATQTVTGAYSSGGFVEVDSTNMPGVYRLDVPNAAFNSGVRSVLAMCSGATGMAPLLLEVDLDTEVNVTHLNGTVQTARDLGASVLISSGTGAGQLNVTDGRINANVTHVNGTTQTGRDLGASVLISSGTGTGQLSVTDGRIDANITHVNGTAQTLGRVDANVTHLNGSTLESSMATAADVASDVWDEVMTGHTTGSTAGAYLANIATAPPTAQNVWEYTTRAITDKAGFSLATAPPTADAITDAVWNEIMTGHTDGTTAGKYLLDASTGSSTLTAQQVWEYTPTRALTEKTGFSLAVAPPTTDAIADAVWDELMTGHTVESSAAAAIADIDTEVDAIKAGIEGIAVTGAALNALASAATHANGSVTGGTYASTYLDNGVYHITQAADGSTNARLIDYYYDFALPNISSIPTQIKIVGYVKETAPAGGDTVSLQVWNGSDWEIIEPTLFTGTIAITPVDEVKIHALFSRFAFNDGGTYKVRARIYSNTLEDNATLGIDQAFISYAEAISANVAAIKAKTDSLTYTVSGVVDANTTYVNGTVANLPTAQNVWEYTTRALTDKVGFSLATAPPTADAITDAVWNEIMTGHTDGTTAGKYLLDASTGSSTLTAQQVWEYTPTRSLTEKTGFSLATAPPTADEITDAVWNEIMSGHTDGTTAGKYLLDASTGGTITLDPEDIEDIAAAVAAAVGTAPTKEQVAAEVKAVLRASQGPGPWAK